MSSGESGLPDRAEQLFHGLVDVPAGERERLFSEACGGDEELLADVRELLAADASADGFFERVGGELERRAAGALENGVRPAASVLRAGQTLGDFRLVREIGRGGMGVVWEARQLSLGRSIALKLLPPERLWSSSALERFRREAEALGRIEHPLVVAVHAIGEAEGIPFIAEELVEGGRTLADYLEEVRRAPELPRDYDRDTARLFLGLAQALEAAHRCGVVHRDVKPTNILLAPDGRARLADFGLARLEGEPGLSLTQDIVGTPCYMSPEHARSGKEVGPRSDVFSLGATLYEALTLQRPFEGDSRSEVLERIQRDDPLDPRALRPRLPRDLALIALTALEKRPEHRYASMAALAEDLRRTLAHEPILARPSGRRRRIQKWILRHPVRSTVLGLGSAALAAVACLLALALVNAREAAQRARDVLSLSAAQDLEKLVARADGLWPARAELAMEYERWLADADALLAGLAGHRERLVAIRERIERSGSTSQDEWWARELEELIEDLEGLAEAGTGLIHGLTPEHGLGIARRLELARTIEERTVSSDASRARWAEAIASIADPAQCPAYAGLRIEPQLGLVPIGPDPSSGLWEFGHPETGFVPERDAASGELVLTEESGLVFVLLPGGACWMGAQKEDPDGTHHDPQAHINEGPVHRVSLRPFLLSKYEMTQGQWLRSTGTNPSWYWLGTDSRPADPRPLLHPVEQVSWFDCERVLRRLGLILPTEAQWEYAARGGTTTPWWTGAEQESLRGAANLADRSAARSGFDWLSIQAWPDFDDGFPVHVHVNTLRANPFGLHHVHGNVLEWCRDLWVSDTSYRLPTSAGGERLQAEPVPYASRVFRGGCFDRDAYSARSAYRYNSRPEYQAAALGLRPARLLEE